MKTYHVQIGEHRKDATVIADRFEIDGGNLVFYRGEDDTAFAAFYCWEYVTEAIAPVVSVGGNVKQIGGV